MGARGLGGDDILEPHVDLNFRPRPERVGCAGVELVCGLKRAVRLGLERGVGGRDQRGRLVGAHRNAPIAHAAAKATVATTGNTTLVTIMIAVVVALGAPCVVLLMPREYVRRRTRCSVRRSISVPRAATATRYPFATHFATHGLASIRLYFLLGSKVAVICR